METVKKASLVPLFVLSITILGHCQESFQFNDFGEPKSFKRGKSYVFTWRSGPYVENVLTFQLKKGGVTVMEWPEVENIESHEFMFPVSLKLGKDYDFDVLDQNGTLYSSQSLRIKRKVPLVVKFTPIFVAGIVILTLPKESSPEFPGVPGPPDGN